MIASGSDSFGESLEGHPRSSRIANAPTKPIFHQHRYARELDRVVQDGCAWLDIGAGHVLHRSWLPPSPEDLAHRAFYLAGCDVGQDVLKHPHLHDARVADASSLPWKDGSFDVVTANMVLEHLPTPADVFREVHRVLKPGGVFVFVTPNRRHPIVALAAVLIPPGLRRWYGVNVERRAASDVFVTFYRCNTVAGIQRLSRAAGFVPEVLEAFVSEYAILPSVFGRVERWLGRVAARHPSGQRHGADIIGVLRRP